MKTDSNRAAQAYATLVQQAGLPKEPPSSMRELELLLRNVPRALGPVAQVVRDGVGNETAGLRQAVARLGGLDASSGAASRASSAAGQGARSSGNLFGAVGAKLGAKEVRTAEGLSTRLMSLASTLQGELSTIHGLQRVNEQTLGKLRERCADLIENLTATLLPSLHPEKTEALRWLVGREPLPTSRASATEIARVEAFLKLSTNPRAAQLHELIDLGYGTPDYSRSALRFFKRREDSANARAIASELGMTEQALVDASTSVTKLSVAQKRVADAILGLGSKDSAAVKAQPKQIREALKQIGALKAQLTLLEQVGSQQLAPLANAIQAEINILAKERAALIRSKTGVDFGARAAAYQERADRLLAARHTSFNQQRRLSGIDVSSSSYISDFDGPDFFDVMLWSQVYFPNSGTTTIETTTTYGNGDVEGPVGGYIPAVSEHTARALFGDLPSLPPALDGSPSENARALFGDLPTSSPSIGSSDSGWSSRADDSRAAAATAADTDSRYSGGSTGFSVETPSYTSSSPDTSVGGS